MLTVCSVSPEIMQSLMQPINFIGSLKPARSPSQYFLRILDDRQNQTAAPAAPIAPLDYETRNVEIHASDGQSEEEICEHVINSISFNLRQPVTHELSEFNAKIDTLITKDPASLMLNASGMFLYNFIVSLVPEYPTYVTRTELTSAFSILRTKAMKLSPFVFAMFVIPPIIADILAELISLAPKATIIIIFLIIGCILGVEGALVVGYKVEKRNLCNAMQAQEDVVMALQTLRAIWNKNQHLILLMRNALN